MEIPALDPRLVAQIPRLRDTVEELNTLFGRYANVPTPPVTKTDQSFQRLSWRCQCLANANLLRGQELLRFAILAINEGAAISAFVLNRAMTETLSAVVFARRKIARAIDSRDAERVAEVMNRLTAGNRYMAEEHEGFPRPYSVLTMIDETGKHLKSLLPSDKSYDPREFRRNYEMVSEMVHPSHGSFVEYQAFKNGVFTFARENANQREWVPAVVSELAMSAACLLEESAALAATADLPVDWPMGA